MCPDKTQIPQGLLQFGWPWDSVLAVRCVCKFLGGASLPSCLEWQGDAWYSGSHLVTIRRDTIPRILETERIWVPEQAPELPDDPWTAAI